MLSLLDEWLMTARYLWHRKFVKIEKSVSRRDLTGMIVTEKAI